MTSSIYDMTRHDVHSFFLIFFHSTPVQPERQLMEEIQTLLDYAKKKKKTIADQQPNECQLFSSFVSALNQAKRLFGNCTKLQKFALHICKHKWGLWSTLKRKQATLFQPQVEKQQRLAAQFFFHFFVLSKIVASIFNYHKQHTTINNSNLQHLLSLHERRGHRSWRWRWSWRCLQEGRSKLLRCMWRCAQH